MPKRQDSKLYGFELRDVIPEFLADYRTASPKTLDFHRINVAKHLFAFLDGEGVALVSDVTPIHIRAWLNSELGREFVHKGHKRQIQPGTVQGRYSSARRFFQWCCEQDYLERNPVDKVRAPRLPRYKLDGFNTTEIRRLMAESRRGWKWIGARDHAILCVLLDTGARNSELTGLNLHDIDWPRHKVLLHGKGAKDRRVPLGSRAAKAIKSYLHVRPDVKTERLFITLRKGPMTAQSLDAMLKALGRYAGVDGVHAHRFRHTFASNHYRHNKDVLALRNLLGHSKITTTEGYLRDLGFEYGTEYGDFPSVLDSFGHLD